MSTATERLEEERSGEASKGAQILFISNEKRDKRGLGLLVKRKGILCRQLE